jgi:uncharacterized protein YkwD
MKHVMRQSVSVFSMLTLVAIAPLWLIFPRSLPLPPQPGIDSPVSTGKAPNQPEYTGCGGQIAPLVNADYEQQVVELTNAERAKAGLPPLKRTNSLDLAARYHATDMGQDDYFNHDSYDIVGGNLQLVCIWSARISSYYTNYSSLSENIAAGYRSPQSVISGWMNSPGHKANILRTSSWEIGVGYYTGSGGYSTYWVQDFGKRNGVYPLVINSEAASTDSRDVSVYIYGTWSQIRLRNDAESWSAWLPFQNRMNWQLPNRAGEHTVSAEMRDSSKTVSSSDTIMLNISAAPELGGLPIGLSFTYSIPDHQFIPQAVQVTPLNSGDQTPMNWEVTTSGSWFTAAPMKGTTPESITIAPTEFPTGTTGSYNGWITVTVTSPASITGSPHTIALSLHAIDSPIQSIYLPLIDRNNLK